MIRNTEERVVDLSERIDKIDPKEAKSFRSRLNFAEGQLDQCTVKLLLVLKKALASGMPGR